MPSKIGQKAHFVCTSCNKPGYGYVDVFWKRRPDGTWETTCIDCQEKRRRQLAREADRAAPKLPFSLN
jgi:hypothetical protein